MYIETPWGIFPSADAAADAFDDDVSLFEPGDVVVLNSGGEFMTVEDICECGSVHTVWFSGNDIDGWMLYRDSFAEEMLTLVEDHDFSDVPYSNASGDTLH